MNLRDFDNFQLYINTLSNNIIGNTREYKILYDYHHHVKNITKQDMIYNILDNIVCDINGNDNQIGYNYSELDPDLYNIIYEKNRRKYIDEDNSDIAMLSEKELTEILRKYKLLDYGNKYIFRKI